MSSKETEHLSSVHNNPFMRQFGLQLHSRTDTDAPSITSSASSERGDDDAENEYHVNSGFVNKLRSRFTQLESKSSRVTLSKKSASVENLLSIGQDTSNEFNVRNKRLGSAGRSSNDDSSLSGSNKVNLRALAPSGYKPQIKDRPRSNEVLRSSDKPPLANRKGIENLKQNNVIRSVKPPMPKKNVDANATRRLNRPSSSEIINIPKTEHHDWKVAPDLEKVGRDNIVIIESGNSQRSSIPYDSSDRNSQRTDSTSSKRESSSSLQDVIGQVKPITEKEKESDENEMPKPNTVSNFRSLFEKTDRVKMKFDALHAWRSHHSPPRKSSGSDTSSPQVLSPVSTPRSPLAKVTSDNVFDNDRRPSDTDTNLDKTSSQDENADLNVLRSDRSSPNIDNKPSSMQDMLRKFQQTSEEREIAPVKRRSASPEKQVFTPEKQRSASPEVRSLMPEHRRSASPEKPTSPRAGSVPVASVQHSLTPVHPVSKVFDSKSLIKADKPKKPRPPKPTVYERQGSVPKDVVELKHEADEKRRSLIEEIGGLDMVLDVKENEVFEINDTAAGVSYDTNIKPSMKKEKDNISPRQTKVFDSSQMVKKNRDRPRSLTSPVESPANVPFPNNVPSQGPVQAEIEIVDRDATKDKETSLAKPSSKTVIQVNNSGKTEIKPNIIRTEMNGEAENTNKSRKFKVSDQMFPKLDSNSSKPKSKTNSQTKPADNKEAPVSGMSSFLANRLKKTQPDIQENQLKTTSNHLANGSSPSPVPRKRQAPEVPVNGSLEPSEEKSAPPLPNTPEPKVLFPMKSKKLAPKPASGKMIFDSSKIATKRKEPPKRKPPRKTLDELNREVKSDSVVSVPKLDLTCITDAPQTEYQEGYIPTDIKPCPFKFINAEVRFQKSPFKRTRRAKVKISFNDHATTTFEYEGEESALQNYLIDHPDEEDEAIREQEEALNGDVDSALDLPGETPQPPTEPETHMKSNTVIGHNPGTGLTSYKSKMQTQEFQFGVQQEEPVYSYTPEPRDNEEEDSFQLLPAGDNDVDTFSAETGKADMLF